MRIPVTIFVILISTYIVNSSVLDPVIENVVHLKASTPPSGVPGIWKKKTIWKPRWVKEWKSAKVMKPVWRKVWSPVQIREWLPIPKPPPGWDSSSTKLTPIHTKSQKTNLKDSFAHDSYTVQSKIPLWDPVPYPESQQPPPPPPQPLYHTDSPCGTDGCDNTPSHSFNHEQISEILGTRYQTPDYYQTQEYSETVNHLTRLPPDPVQWRPPQPLPEFLIPPRYPTGVQQSTPQSSNILINHSPGFEIPKWSPQPSIVPKTQDQPLKFQFPEVRTGNTTTAIHPDKIHPQGNRDFIQEAELVGEYHYSVFDDLNGAPESQRGQIIKESLEKTLQREQSVKQSVENILQREKILRPPENRLQREQNVRQQENRLQREQNVKQAVENKQQGEQIIKVPAENIYQKDLIVKKPLENKLQREQIVKQPQNILQKEPIVRHPLENKLQKEHTLQQPENILRKEQTAKQPENRLQRDHTLQQPPENKLQTEHTLKQSENKANATPSIKEVFPPKPTTESYPIYEIPQKIHPVFIPLPHRFSTSNTTKLQPITPVKDFKPLPDTNTKLQIVFATTPIDYDSTLKSTTTTTEPYEVIFASSLRSISTTESVTKTPVIVVTPNKS